MALIQEYMQDDKFRNLLAQEELIMEVTELLCKLIDEEGISRNELAKRLGKTKGFISQLLNGGRNLTLRTIADIISALGYKVTLNSHKVDHEGKECSFLGTQKIHFLPKKYTNWGLISPRAPENYPYYKVAS